MKLLAFIGPILLATIVLAETPIDFNKWHVSDSTYQVRLGVGDPRNYQKPDKSWAKIKNNFVAEGDSVLKADEAVLKSRVNKNGKSSVTLNWGGQDYVVSQKLLGIGWLKISTRGRQWIDDTMDWSNVSADSNIVTWTEISPGVDYRVGKSSGSVAHGIFFKPAFLDAAVILYNQRPDSLDIALANVMVYTLSSNIDNYDSDMGELSWRQLKAFTGYTFKLNKQRLRYPVVESPPFVSAPDPIPVKQFWRKRNDSIFCIEYVMMSDMKAVHQQYPSVTVWHNDTKTISGTTNMDDAYINSSSPDNNYGGSTALTSSLTSGSHPIIRVKNVASEIGAGATITAAVCSLNNFNHITNGTITAYSVFKPWVEGDENGTNDDDGDVTYNDWASDASEWGTEGCLCARDAGVDNSADDGACNNPRADRKSTGEEGESVNATGWYEWDMSAALAQAWYDGDKNEEGILLHTTNTVCQFRSTEAASDQPFWVFTFTVAAAGGAIGTVHDTSGVQELHNIDSTKQIHSLE